MNRRAILLLVGGAVVVLAGWYLFLWGPSHRQLDDAKKRRANAESQQAQLQVAVDRLRSAQKDEPLQRAKLESLRTAIPDTPNLAQFIFDTNDAATKSGIDFISISPSLPTAVATATTTTTSTTVAGAATTTTVAGTATAPATTGSAPAQILVTLQIKGGYFQVLDFLNRLDRLPRLVVTDAVNINADERGALTVGMTARMFVRAVPSGFPGGTATTSTTSTTVAGGATTTTAAGGATTTTAAGGRP
jgi:Tfp pilus assembly protein PilO